MKKILIGAHNLDQFVLTGATELCLGPEHILTPGAKDMVRNRGISIVYGKPDPKPADEGKDRPEAPQPVLQDHVPSRSRAAMAEYLSMQITKLLKEEFNVTDEKRIRYITLAVLKRIGEPA